MKKMKISATVTRFSLGALFIALSAFAVPGGNSYTIYLNQKLVAKKYLWKQTVAPDISLGQPDLNDEYQVYFSQCGEIGKSRTLSVLDGNKKQLKEWKFPDTTSEHVPMAFKASEIIALPRSGTNSLRLMYTSKELTEGILLANFVFSKETAKK